MENIEKLLTNWQLHPVVDHFSIALLVVAVVIDIVALIFSQRVSLRHTALTLMIIGAVAAAASYATGDIEGDRVWDLVGGKAREVLKLHAQIGYYLMIAFAVLALWRILIEVFAFMRSSRQIYLALAVVAVIALLYQGSLGGELVYTFGVGTGPMAAGAVKALAAETPKPEQSTEASAPTSIPTVYVPTAATTPAPSEAPPTAAPAKPAGTSSPGQSPEPSAQPSAKPSV
ncbi:MAG TPA: DUF2231 domain-containing protein [Candidatus Binataceae bacterium]